MLTQRLSIICRAFQGIGGAGVYSLTLLSLLRLVPRERYDLVTAITAAIMSGGLVLGPLAGGAIDTSGAWRWIFLLKYVDQLFNCRTSQNAN